MITPIDKSPFCQQVQDCSTIDELLQLPFRLSDPHIDLATDQWCRIEVTAWRSEREPDEKKFTPWLHPHDSVVISYCFDWGLFEYATMALMHHLLTGVEAERPVSNVGGSVWLDSYHEYRGLGSDSD
jgi:hypothetical protein